MGELADPAHRNALYEVVLRVLEVADRYYASSWLGISQLPPRSAWAIAAANAVYCDIGRLITERGPGGLDRRASTSKLRKISLVLGAAPKAWAARHWGKGPADEPRTGLWTRPR